MSAITDPQHRRDIAAVMAELSEFRMLLGRPDIMSLEIEATLDRLLGQTTPANTVPLLGSSVAWRSGDSEDSESTKTMALTSLRWLRRATTPA